jgi:hypothetical protein
MGEGKRERRGDGGARDDEAREKSSGGKREDRMGNGADSTDNVGNRRGGRADAVKGTAVATWEANMVAALGSDVRTV